MASKNNKQKDKLVNDLDAQLKKIDNSLKSLKDSMQVLQEGTGNKPYWNGSNAYNFVKSTLGYIDNDTTLLNYLTDCKKNIK